LLCHVEQVENVLINYCKDFLMQQNAQKTSFNYKMM